MARFSVAVRNAALDTFISGSNSGLIRVYDDSAARPATSDTAVPGGSVLLATLTLNSTSFVRTDGTLTANAITEDSAADASGTPLWIRVLDSGGTSPRGDFGVTTSAPSDGSEFQISASPISSGQEVSCSSFVITFGVGA